VLRNIKFLVIAEFFNKKRMLPGRSVLQFSEPELAGGCNGGRFASRIICIRTTQQRSCTGMPCSSILQSSRATIFPQIQHATGLIAAIRHYLFGSKTIPRDCPAVGTLAKVVAYATELTNRGDFA
jgi:hypothetical protein